MFQFCLAYRHRNGEVEGFSAHVFQKENGKRNCLAKIQAKCADIGQPFDSGRVIESFSGLTPEEKKTIAADWQIESRNF